MSFNTSFVQAFNPAFQQSGQAVIDLQRQKMQEAIQEESRKRALQDQIDQGLLAKWQEAYSTTPPPMVTGTDGNQSLNRASMRGLLSEYESKKKDDDLTRQLESKRKIETESKATSLGVDKSPFAIETQPGTGFGFVPKLEVGVKAAPLEQRVAEKEQQNQLDQFKREHEIQSQLQQDAYNSRDPAVIRTANHRAELASNISDLVDQRNAFLESGQEIPADFSRKFSVALNTWNALGRQGEAVDPGFQDKINQFSLRPLPAAQVEKLNTGLSTIKQATRAIDQMEQAAKIVGGIDKLAEYVGIGRTQGREAISKLLLPDEGKAAVLDALQAAEQVRAAARYQLYAGNLTENEAEKFNLQAGNPNNRDFFDRTRTFFKNTYSKENDRLDALSKQYYVPKTIQSDFSGARDSIFGAKNKQDGANPFSNMSDDELEKRKAALRAKNN